MEEGRKEEKRLPPAATNKQKKQQSKQTNITKYQQLKTKPENAGLKILTALH